MLPRRWAHLFLFKAARNSVFFCFKFRLTHRDRCSPSKSLPSHRKHSLLRVRRTLFSTLRTPHKMVFFSDESGVFGHPPSLLLCRLSTVVLRFEHLEDGRVIFFYNADFFSFFALVALLFHSFPVPLLRIARTMGLLFAALVMDSRVFSSFALPFCRPPNATIGPAFIFSPLPPFPPKSCRPSGRLPLLCKQDRFLAQVPFVDFLAVLFGFPQFQHPPSARPPDSTWLPTRRPTMRLFSFIVRTPTWYASSAVKHPCRVSNSFFSLKKKLIAF